MPLHKIDRERNKLISVTPTTYAIERWRERDDLQPLLRDNPEVLDPDLLIVAEEFNDWQGSSRRIDLLGLDKEGSLVVIEVKREEDGGHMELQAVRYAAMVSSMDFEAVVRAYAAKHGTDAALARQDIGAFLGVGDADEPVITNLPRIILVAPNFSREITTTVLWLNDQGLGIRCIAANLYKIQEDYYLQIDQVIPLPAAADYQFKMREKTMKAERDATVTRRGRRSLEILIKKGLLTEGTRINLLRPPRAGLVIPDERAKRATFQGGDKFVWEYDGRPYALSKLCETIVEEFGGDVRSGSFPGPDFWAIDGETLSLAKRAREIEAA